MPAGAKPGERRGGRAKGTPNHATKELKELARQHCEAALETIVQLMQSSENDQTRLAAAKELIDRGYGKAVQSIEADVQGNLGVQIVTLPKDEAL